MQFLGGVDDATRDACLRGCRCFCLPSRGEGFGLVYIEAMRHGLPVLASVHDAGQEVVMDGVTGYTVDLDRPGHLATRLVELLKDHETTQRMGDAARDQWARNYRFSAFRDRLAPILTEFLAL